MPISVTDSKGKIAYIQTDGSGNVNDVTSTGANKMSAQELQNIKQALQNTNVGEDNGAWDETQLLEKIADISKLSNLSGTDGDKAAKRLDALNKEVGNLKKQLNAEYGKSPQSPALIAKLEAAYNTGKSSLQQLFENLNASKAQLSAASQTIVNNTSTSPNLTPGSGSGAGAGGGAPGGPFKAQVNSSSNQPQAQQGGAPGQFPTGKAQTGMFGSGPGIDLSSYLQSNMMQGMNMNSFDQIGKSQAEQQKMMQLFMYFAMMAMSGDVGAMTNFMQFITMIIQKDKGLQNINLANKLIELEDANRKAVDQLTNTPSYDPNNQQVAADFTKTMERVKADEGSIATSQKLISQMMEDFAQVSEFLNNLQKSMMDVRGRILSRLSSFNA